jgi:exopolysaccharide production protein ExoQ
MPPRVALVLTVASCSALLWYDARQKPRRSPALWLPVAWIFFVGSRFLSQWLEILGLLGGGGSSMEDGSPLDAAFFLCIILSGIIVLTRRHVNLAHFARNNVWLTVFFGYCFLAIFWSDFPLVAFKRWIKILGHPVMALVILTDPDPVQAMKSVLKRAGFIMLPLSVLFIKYYPELGRYFDAWTGEPGNGGIHHNKNELGYACLIFGLFFFWNLLTARRLTDAKIKRQELLISLIFVGILWWLFLTAHSATSLVCTLLGVTTIVLLGSRLVSRRFIGTQLVIIVLALVAIELSFGVYARGIDLLGRDPTLTDRTEVWADLFKMDINPIFGAGFESFWLGSRLDIMWAKWWWRPNQAHNGYIETYLNLGWLGVFLLGGVIVATFRKGRAELLRNVDYGRFRLAFLFAILAYNYTEAAFKGVHLVWTMFHLIAIDYPIASSAVASTARDGAPAERSSSRRWLRPSPALAAIRGASTRSGQATADVTRKIVAKSPQRPTS